jgi:hypothetical protein
MTPTTGTTVRHDAIAELFEALEALMFVYQSPPEAERVECWSADAERITGEVARHLSAARGRVSQRPHVRQRPRDEELPGLDEWTSAPGAPAR